MDSPIPVDIMVSLRISIIIIGIFIIGIILWPRLGGISKLEPRFQGLTASEWVVRRCRNPDDTEAERALRELGPNAAPALIQAVLIESLACKDERSIHGWYERVNGKRRPLKVGTEIKLFEVVVLGLLSAQAQSALAALRELSSTPDEKIVNRTRRAI